MKAKALGLTLLLAAGAVSASEYVPGYIRSDGTYVQGHFRSTPNNTKIDNYSTRGNTNPYTGQRGSVDPYKVEVPTYQQREYQAPRQQPYQPYQYQPYSGYNSPPTYREYKLY